MPQVEQPIVALLPVARWAAAVVSGMAVQRPTVITDQVAVAALDAAQPVRIGRDVTAAGALRSAAARASALDHKLVDPFHIASSWLERNGVGFRRQPVTRDGIGGRVQVEECHVLLGVSQVVETCSVAVGVVGIAARTPPRDDIGMVGARGTTAAVETRVSQKARGVTQSTLEQGSLLCRPTRPTGGRGETAPA